MDEFSRLCVETECLRRLQSVTLTVHQQMPLEIWMRDVVHLLSTAPLELFQIYCTDAFIESRTTNEFWADIVTTHHALLKRFSVHRMLISLDAIEDICLRCSALEQLFVVVEQGSLVISSRTSYQDNVR